MHTAAVFIGNTLITRAGPREHTAVIDSRLCVLCLQPCFLLRHCFLQRGNLGILLGNHVFIFLDGRLFVGNVTADRNNLGLFLPDQAVDIGLLLFYRLPRLVQKLFFHLKLFLAEFHVLACLHILIQLISVIAGQRLDIIGAVHDPGNAVGAKQCLHIKRVAALIHELNAFFHGRILLFLSRLGFIQISERLLNLFFFIADHSIILCDLLLYVSELSVQLLHKGCQVVFRLLQLLFQLLHVSQIALQAGNLLLCLLDLPLLLADTLACDRLHCRRGSHAGKYKSKT